MTAYLAVSRLIDNYEDKGDIPQFDELNELIAKAIETSPHYARIMQICNDNGILCDGEYADEQDRRESLADAIACDIMGNLTDSNLCILSDALLEHLNKWTIDELVNEYKERVMS